MNEQIVMLIHNLLDARDAQVFDFEAQKYFLADIAVTFDE